MTDLVIVALGARCLALGLTINRANSYDQRLRIYGAITISYVI
jgi:hypothetical protein